METLTLDFYKNRRCYTMADVMKGSDADGGFSDLVEKSYSHPFLKAMRKSNNALTAVDANALGELSNIIIGAPAPDAIGRQLVIKVDTVKPSVRFRKPKLAKAYDTNIGGEKTESIGERYDWVDINCNLGAEASEEWSLDFVEDAEWDVLSAEAAAIGEAVKVRETEKILATYEGIADGSLAGGAAVSAASAGTTSYADLVNLWGKVKAQNRTPNVCFMHPDQFTDLWKDEKFISSLFFGEFVDKSRGVFGRSILGFDIVVSSLVTATHVYMVDTKRAVGFPLRRDTLVVPYDPTGKKTMAGVQATTRFGLGVLDSAAVARMNDG